VDAKRDLVVVEGPVDVLDHAAPSFALGAKIGVDATKKWAEEGGREWPEPCVHPPEVLARMDALYERLVPGAVPPKRPKIAAPPAASWTPGRAQGQAEEPAPERAGGMGGCAAAPHLQRRAQRPTEGEVAMAKGAMKAQPSAGPAQERAGLDWGHLRFFLELARSGSLARAAQRLAVDRNTVARRVATLEAELGLPLFERGPQGWTRTAAGDELAALASRVEEDVLALARHAEARDRALTGSVRLTTATHLSAYLLVPALPALRERHPGLVLEIAADQRMGRPRDAGLVTRKLSDVAYGLYASRRYLTGRRAEVDFAADAFLTFDDSLAGTPQERWLARTAPERRVVFRCNSTASLQAAARAGLGVAMLPRFVADCDAELVRLASPPLVHHELWLLVHGDLRRTPRVRAVIEWVDALVERARPALSGEA
jgi:DNA-binding transcriptional LysR family regulator